MQPVRVHIRSTQEGAPAPIEVDGLAPYPASPLAVTPVATWSPLGSVAEWRIEPGRWQITHRASGFNLGAREWDTAEAALAVLQRCDPAFPAWAAVKWGVADDALVACRYKFRMACEGAA